MVVEQSIFISTKDVLDIASDDPSFDSKVLSFINGALSDLVDFGIGPPEGFAIEGDGEEWGDLLGDYPDLNRVKTWLYLKVMLLWDPPQTSFLIDMRQKQIDAIEWRLMDKEDGDRYEAQQSMGG